MLDEQLDDKGSFLIGRGKSRVLNLGIVPKNVLARKHKSRLAMDT